MFQRQICRLEPSARICLNSRLNARSFSKIVATDDGSTLVALHPEKEFPYELTRPLPEETPNEDNSVLKMSDINEIKRVFKSMQPEVAREELCRVTMTTKHRWFPRARDKKAKNTPMNRPYL